MYRQIKEIIADETGAITVNWIVLTAAIVGLGLATALAVSGSLHENTIAVDAMLQAYEIDAEFDDEAEIIAIMARADALRTAAGADPAPAQTD